MDKFTGYQDRLNQYSGWGVLWENGSSVLLYVTDPEFLSWAAAANASCEIVPKLWRSVHAIGPKLGQVRVVNSQATTVGDVLYDWLGHDDFE